MILIVSLDDDLHAAVVRGRVQELGYRECHVVACNRLARREALSVSISRAGVRGYVTTTDGHALPLDECRVIWLRRLTGAQDVDRETLDPTSLEIIDNDCRAGLVGALTSGFRGTWVSSPAATTEACDKLLQLAAARACGFRVPETLVTQCRRDVIEFHARHGGRIIVKTLAGTGSAFLVTRFVENPLAMEETAYAMCPAIYQEYVPGARHIRLNCFGDRSYAAMIESEQLDWRPDLNVPIRAWAVPGEVHDRIVSVLARLGLEMGIVDLKETPDGELVWLEVNPQGQFLFLDAMTNLNLATRFSEYLIETALTAESDVEPMAGAQGPGPTRGGAEAPPHVPNYST